MKIEESILDNILDRTTTIEIPGIKIERIELSSPIVINDDDNLFELPILIKCRKFLNND